MKGDDIALRLLNFAAQVLRIVSNVSSTVEGRHVTKQLIRCATAPGAHYDEARGAESRPDFVHKIKIAGKEMRESRYWLRLIHHAKLAPNIDLSPILSEASELVAILTTSAKTAAK